MGHHDFPISWNFQSPKQVKARRIELAKVRVCRLIVKIVEDRRRLGASIEIEFYDNNDLDRILELLLEDEE